MKPVQGVRAKTPSSNCPGLVGIRISFFLMSPLLRSTKGFSLEDTDYAPGPIQSMEGIDGCSGLAPVPDRIARMQTRRGLH